MISYSKMVARPTILNTTSASGQYTNISLRLSTPRIDFDNMADSQQAISLPSLLLVAAIGAAALRYFFYSPSDSTSRSGTSATRHVNPQHVEQVAAMFPQIPIRDIMWDLQRNGGNVAATTERVLSTGRLETVCITPDPY